MLKWPWSIPAHLARISIIIARMLECYPCLPYLPDHVWALYLGDVLSLISSLTGSGNGNVCIVPRRLSTDYERIASTEEAFIYLVYRVGVCLLIDPLAHRLEQKACQTPS